MTRALNVAIKRTKKGYYLPLITHEGDELELASFIRHLADHLLELGQVEMIKHDEAPLSGNGIDLIEGSATGVAFLRADKLTERQTQKLAKSRASSNPKRLVIANFDSFAKFATVREQWPSILKNAFYSKPLVWPSLNERGADLEGIVDEICKTLCSEDECRRAMIADDALHEILQMSFDNTYDLRRLLVHAFDIMLEQTELIISQRTLTQAKERTSHRRSLRTSQADAFA
jgi:hypothetical protein